MLHFRAIDTLFCQFSHACYAIGVTFGQSNRHLDTKGKTKVRSFKIDDLFELKMVVSIPPYGLSVNCIYHRKEKKTYNIVIL